MLKYAAESIANVKAVWDEITKDHELARFRSVAEKEQGNKGPRALLAFFPHFVLKAALWFDYVA